MRKFIALIVVIVFSNNVSYSQYFGKNKARYKSLKFKVAQSENFEMYHYFKTNEPKERMLENSQIWYSKHKEIFGKGFDQPNPLIIYQNHPDFQETTAIDGEIGEGTGGVTEGFKNRVVMPMMYSHRQTDHVLGHELVHAFQYNLMKTDTSLSLQNIQNLPLWMVEGLAEFMSIGRVDSHTAMWMRDGVQKKQLPTLKDLNDYNKYFPYRWGQAFWAYISGTYGDAVIEPLFKSTATYGLEKALKFVLNSDSKTISDDWKRVLNESYGSYLGSMELNGTGNKIAYEKNAGHMNIAPSVSPNGKFLAYISERNVISLDIYIADIETGKILKRFNLDENRSHVDAINFLETSGTWSPNSNQLAYVIQSKGKNKLMTLNIASGKRTVYNLPDLDSFINPTWSPNGESVVVSGLKEGVSDLYLYNFESKTVQNLTNDFYSDMMPNWAPDGNSVFFVSDRTSNGTRLEMANYNIAKIDINTKIVENFTFFPKADNLNPCIDATGNNLYFLSDADGFRNLFRYNLETKGLEKLTNFFTGISGVTMHSPAISVAQKADKIVYSMLKNGKYELYSATSKQFGAFPLDPSNVNKRTAILPPIYTSEKENIVQKNVESDIIISKTDKKPSKEAEYKSKFKLDYIGTTGTGVGVNSQYGIGLSGAIQGIFSDVLGNHQLQGALALQGGIKDFGGQLIYLNQKKPFQWGFNLSHIPYTVSGQKQSDDTVSIKQSNGNVVRVPAQKVSTYNQRQFNNTIEAFTFFPFNTHVRLEAGGGLNWVSFNNERIDEYYDNNNIDNLLGSKKEKLPADDSYKFQELYGAWVGDNATFGLTSPLNGYRYRMEARQIFGVIKVTNYLADLRKYKYLRPISLAGRFLFNARNGKDAETQALQPLFIGYPGYVRGYYGRSLDKQLDAGVDIAQLIGTRMAMASFEVRLPFTGPKKLALIKSGFFLTDLAWFIDVGGSWKGGLLGSRVKTETPSTNTQYLITTNNIVDRFRYDPVGSTGFSLRLNLFGYLVLEPYYAMSIHSGKIHKGCFGLNLVPGW
jgi:Tol biopolymer transport system component